MILKSEPVFLNEVMALLETAGKQRDVLKALDLQVIDEEAGDSFVEVLDRYIGCGQVPSLWRLIVLLTLELEGVEADQANVIDLLVIRELFQLGP